MSKMIKRFVGIFILLIQAILFLFFQYLLLSTSILLC